MQRNVVTATPETTLPQAMALMHHRGVRHLPVLEEEKLVGILSDRDVKRVQASPATNLEAHELRYLLDRMTVGETMTRHVHTVPSLATIEEAAELMRRHKIGCVPVVEGGLLVGILTETDLLTVLIQVMGVGRPSSRIKVELSDLPGALAGAVQIIARLGINITSVVTLPPVLPEQRTLLFRIETLHPGSVIRALEERGVRVLSSRRSQEGSP